jgi:hypothetical protein
MWFSRAPVSAAARPVAGDCPEPARLEALAALYPIATVRLGPPSAAHLAAVAAIAEPARLSELTARVGEAASWDELLGLVGPQAAATAQG